MDRFRENRKNWVAIETWHSVGIWELGRRFAYRPHKLDRNIFLIGRFDVNQSSSSSNQSATSNKQWKRKIHLWQTSHKQWYKYCKDEPNTKEKFLYWPVQNLFTDNVKTQNMMKILFFSTAKYIPNSEFVSFTGLMCSVYSLEFVSGSQNVRKYPTTASTRLNNG